MKLSSPSPSLQVCVGQPLVSRVRALSEIFKCLRAFHTRPVAPLRGCCGLYEGDGQEVRCVCQHVCF